MDSLGEAFDRLANDNRVGSYVKAGARQVLPLVVNLLHAVVKSQPQPACAPFDVPQHVYHGVATT